MNSNSSKVLFENAKNDISEEAVGSNPSELAIMIEEIRKETVAPKKTECIYKVPDDLCGVKKDAYTPKVVSIGPLHYGSDKLQHMETIKKEYLKHFLGRGNLDSNELAKFIKELEPRVRHCYADKIEHGERRLAEIILMDACFIVELFLKGNERKLSAENALLNRRLLGNLTLDLLLLENQLPFFALEELFDWAKDHDGISRVSPSFNGSFLEITFLYFNNLNKQGLDFRDVSIHHFTDLLRVFHLQKPSKDTGDTEDTGNSEGTGVFNFHGAISHFWDLLRVRVFHLQKVENSASNSLPCMDTENNVDCGNNGGVGVLNFNASELHKAGVKFKVIDTTECLLGLDFSEGDLKIPKILVKDITETLIRNMVAFEQCHCLLETPITDYVTILDNLIDSSNDVNVLVQNGIIKSLVGDNDAVAKVFNGLSKGVVWGNCNRRYVRICKQLNDFCSNPRQKLKVTLRRDYCHTPWQTVASIAGILLLFLALLQTIFSGIQVRQRP